MARILNEKDYAEKRSEILAAARSFIYTKGYELMSIQDILDALHISKGAFYHYFNSKQDLLEGLIEQLVDEGLALIAPILENQQLPAFEKFKRYFNTAVRWKTSQKDFLLALMKSWYADENVLVRHKLVAATTKQFTPRITQIIDQGIREGSFHPAYSDVASEVAFSLMMSMGEAFADQLFNQPVDQRSLPRMVRLTAAFTDAIERVLGLPEGSLILVDQQSLEEWMNSSLPVESAGQPRMNP